MNDESSLGLTEAKLERLYLRLERPIHNVVYRWLWSAEDAREVTQDAFLRLWKMRERVDTRTVDPLLFRIALNIAANRRRARRLWRWVGLEHVEGYEGSSGSEATHEQRERERLVRGAIEALPESLRRVVVMCELSDLGYREVGLALGIPEGTVGSRRNKALRLLRQKLAPMVKEDAHVA